MHTPTPWRVDPKRALRVVAGEDDTVATTGQQGNMRDQWEANAAHIVLCVNSHDALVEALTKILNCPGDVNIQPALNYIRETARAALAKARVP